MKREGGIFPSLTLMKSRDGQSELYIIMESELYVIIENYEFLALSGRGYAGGNARSSF